MKNKQTGSIQRWNAFQKKLGKNPSQVIQFIQLSQMKGGGGGDLYSTDSYSGGNPPPK